MQNKNLYKITVILNQSNTEVEFIYLQHATSIFCKGMQSMLVILQQLQ